MSQVQTSGTDLEFEVVGTGEPVLLISTGPIADSFRPLLSAEVLVKRFSLISYRQRRPHHGSEKTEPISFAQHAGDAANLLGHLGIRRAHVAGHSTGAAIALQMALDCPEAVHSLALLEPALLAAPSAGNFFERVGPALAEYGSGNRDAAMKSFLSVVCSLEWGSCKAYIEKHVPGGVAEALERADDFFGSYLPALGDWEFGARQAGSISQPVLSVLGLETDQLFKDSDELLHAWLPQLEECRVEGVAHLLHLQQPEPVARGLSEFFARHSMAMA